MVELLPLDGLMPVTLSISHSRLGLLRRRRGRNRPLGADIEFNERRSAAFAEEYFTPPEIPTPQPPPAEQRDTLTNAIWSGRNRRSKPSGAAAEYTPRVLLAPPA